MNDPKHWADQTPQNSVQLTWTGEGKVEGSWYHPRRTLWDRLLRRPQRRELFEYRLFRSPGETTATLGGLEPGETYHLKLTTRNPEE